MGKVEDRESGEKDSEGGKGENEKEEWRRGVWKIYQEERGRYTVSGGKRNIHQEERGRYIKRKEEDISGGKRKIYQEERGKIFFRY